MIRSMALGDDMNSRRFRGFRECKGCGLVCIKPSDAEGKVMCNECEVLAIYLVKDANENYKRVLSTNSDIIREMKGKATFLPRVVFESNIRIMAVPLDIIYFHTRGLLKNDS